MKIPKVSLKTVIFVLAVAVLIAFGVFWKLNNFSNSGSLSNENTDNFIEYIDRGLSAEARTSLEQKVSDLEALMKSDSTVVADISQWLLLGNMKYQLGDLIGAKEAYEHLLTISPKDAPAHENLAQALYEIGDYSGAESHWREALKTDQWETIYLKLADLIEEKFPERREEARVVLEEAITTLGQTPGLLISLGDWYLVSGEYQRAISHYQIAKQLDSTIENVDEKIKEAREKWSAAQEY